METNSVRLSDGRSCRSTLPRPQGCTLHCAQAVAARQARAYRTDGDRPLHMPVPRPVVARAVRSADLAVVELPILQSVLAFEMAGGRQWRIDPGATGRDAVENGLEQSAATCAIHSGAPVTRRASEVGCFGMAKDWLWTSSSKTVRLSW